MIAYPLHTMRGDSEESLDFLKTQFYFTCACIVGFTVLLVVECMLILFMVKLTREKHLILQSDNNISTGNFTIESSDKSLAFETVSASHTPQ